MRTSAQTLRSKDAGPDRSDVGMDVDVGVEPRAHAGSATLWASRVSSPIGELAVAVDAIGLVAIQLPARGDPSRAAPGPGCMGGGAIDALGGVAWEDGPERTAPAADALGRYFAGDEDAFRGLPLAPRGTRFQLDVWEACSRVGFGETTTYGELAAAVGRPQAARAVGGAMNKNPLAIVVPCHRVLGSGGRLTGYAGGLDMKAWLLRHEGLVP